jgi:hypothetical protein
MCFIGILNASNCDGMGRFWKWRFLRLQVGTARHLGRRQRFPGLYFIAGTHWGVRCSLQTKKKKKKREERKEGKKEEKNLVSRIDK